MALYYFDTSIWLDLFENRDEPNFPKGKWAEQLVQKILREDGRIIFSNVNIEELTRFGYGHQEIWNRMGGLRKIVIFVRSKEKLRGKAKDLSEKRNVPLADALHALIARDTRSLLVAFDKDFEKLRDITLSHKPNSLI